MNVKINSSIHRGIRHRECPINVLSCPRKILKRRYLYYDRFSPLFDLYRIISLTIYAHYGDLVNVQSKLEDKTVLVPAHVISASLLAYRFEFIAVGLSCERVNASCDWKQVNKVITSNRTFLGKKLFPGKVRNPYKLV